MRSVDSGMSAKPGSLGRDTDPAPDSAYVPLATPMCLADQALQGVWPAQTPPLVTVVCRTYNHVDFIAECLQGFVSQITTFPVRLFIHDDASTDGTDRIIADYAERFPALFQVVVQPTNLYSQGISISQWINAHLTTPYVADCEGDDVWIDPHKLQTQIDYLQAHPDCVVTSADATIIDAQGAPVAPSKLPLGQQRSFSAKALLCGRVWLLTLTRVYRNVLPKTPIEESRHIINRDNLTAALLGLHGRAYFHPNWRPAAYRRHAGGVWSSRPIAQKRRLQVKSDYWIYRYFERQPSTPAIRRATNAWFARWTHLAEASGVVGPRTLALARWRWRGLRWLRWVCPASVWPTVVRYVSPRRCPIDKTR